MRVAGVGVLVLLAAAVSADRYHPEKKQSYERSQAQRNPYDFNTAERNPQYWKNEAEEGIQKRLSELQNNKVARNVIMFLGDGMSVPTLAAARTLKGQRQNRTGEESVMSFEAFPTIGLSKTYCLDKQIADSACTATAYLAGVKNNYGTIGVNGDVARHDCLASTDKSTHLDSIAVWALAEGRDAGIVTTTRITHASPAGTYARTANRNWENDADVVAAGFDTDSCPDIAHQLIHTSPGNQFKVILGGGRRSFIPETTMDEEGAAGRRRDDRNLIDEWKADKAARNVGYEYVWNRSELLSLRNSPPEYLLGLFDTNHLQYHMIGDPITEPTLAELTEVAINSLSRNENGYFLFVEGGRIDHAHHDNWPQLALDETLELELAVQKALEMVGDDTLIVVTSDHSHVFNINGYTKRGGDILGPSDDLGDDGIPYMTLSYTNGPGARVHVNNVRPDVTQDANFMGLEWYTHAEVELESETHGGDDVAVFAWGPQHHMFTGMYEQSQIPYRMAYAACIGPGPHAEVCTTSSAGLVQSLTVLNVIALIVSLFYSM